MTKETPTFISVKERLPEAGSTVLVLFENMATTVCNYSITNSWSYAYHCDCCCRYNMPLEGITHWLEHFPLDQSILFEKTK